MANIIIQGENSSFGKTEEYKRSAHTDFMTSKELKDIEFTGVRHNSISDTIEVWTVGDLRASMVKGFAEKHPEAWEKLYNDLFGLN